MIADPDATISQLLDRVDELEDRVRHLEAHVFGLFADRPVELTPDEVRRRGNVARKEVEELDLLEVSHGAVGKTVKEPGP